MPSTTTTTTTTATQATITTNNIIRRPTWLDFCYCTSTAFFIFATINHQQHRYAKKFTSHSLDKGKQVYTSVTSARVPKGQLPHPLVRHESRSLESTPHPSPFTVDNNEKDYVSWADVEEEDTEEKDEGTEGEEEDDGTKGRNKTASDWKKTDWRESSMNANAVKNKIASLKRAFRKVHTMATQSGFGSKDDEGWKMAIKNKFQYYFDMKDNWSVVWTDDVPQYVDSTANLDDDIVADDATQRPQVFLRRPLLLLKDQTT
ncbi:MAG: hypothetical protein J3R72DRAFT_491798 [Linnemannia gamsii]|nr:MAG: hypothetical protein J3R72DRAFT_491798 [Linnemannia gamsii]